MDIQIPYGINELVILKHISEVPSGLECACVCPECGKALVARKGDINAHHFAHYHDAESNCTGAWETILHLLCKEVAKDSHEILLPVLEITQDNKHYILMDAQNYSYNAVSIEVDLGFIRPDVVLHKDGKDVIVEFFVTHSCDDAKKEKFRLFDCID